MPGLSVAEQFQPSQQHRQYSRQRRLDPCHPNLLPPAPRQGPPGQEQETSTDRSPTLQSQQKRRELHQCHIISLVCSPPLLLTRVPPLFSQHSAPSLHPDDRRKADKLKKKKRRKERQHLAEEERAVQQGHSSTSELQLPVSFSERTIKEEPEDDVSIPLHPQRLPSPPPCKIKPKEEHQHWDGQDLEEGMVKVQKIEGFSGSRTVFRQGKQVVFRDEDGSGEDEDIMVDSGETRTHNWQPRNSFILHPE